MPGTLWDYGAIPINIGSTRSEYCGLVEIFSKKKMLARHSYSDGVREIQQWFHTITTLAFNLRGKIIINKQLGRVAVLPLLTEAGQPHFKFSQYNRSLSGLRKISFSLPMNTASSKFFNYQFDRLKRQKTLCLIFCCLRNFALTFCSEHVETTALLLQTFAALLVTASSTVVIVNTQKLIFVQMSFYCFNRTKKS